MIIMLWLLSLTEWYNNNCVSACHWAKRVPHIAVRRAQQDSVSIGPRSTHTVYWWRDRDGHLCNVALTTSNWVIWYSRWPACRAACQLLQHRNLKRMAKISIIFHIHISDASLNDMNSINIIESRSNLFYFIVDVSATCVAFVEMTSGSDSLRKMSLPQRKVRRRDVTRHVPASPPTVYPWTSCQRTRTHGGRECGDMCLVTSLRRTFLRGSDVLRRKSEPEVISTKATDFAENINNKIEKVWSRFNYINNVWQSTDKFIQIKMTWTRPSHWPLHHTWPRSRHTTTTMFVTVFEKKRVVDYQWIGWNKAYWSSLLFQVLSVTGVNFYCLSWNYCPYLIVSQ